MRADRLIAILFAMQRGGTVTVRELADKLEVSPRTVTRDLEALSASGVPIYAERGRGGGWMLAEGFRAAFNGLKRSDLERLVLARSTSEGLFADLGKGKEFGETWDKVLQAATAGSAHDAAGVRDRVHIDGAGWRKSFETLPWLPALYDAVWDRRRLTIRYGRDESERELLPLGLVAKGGTWYVAGLTGGEMRTYRVSRVAELRASGDTFDRPAGFDLETYWQASMASFRERLPSYPATLRLDRETLERLSEARYVTVVEARGAETDPSGEEQRTVFVNFETQEYAVEWLLRLGGEGKFADVLEPEELRDAIRRTVRQLAKQYL